MRKAKRPEPFNLGLDNELAVIRIRHWRDVVAELHDVCERALRYIHRSLRFDVAGILLYDADAKVFRAVKLMSHGEVMDGDEDMPATGRSPLRHIIDGRDDFLVTGGADNAAFVPLQAFGNIFGVLRIHRWRGWKTFRPQERKYLKGLARTLAMAVWRVNLAVQERVKDTQLRTFNEVSVLIHQSLRLQKLLEDVAKRVVKNLGFDRVKIFIKDKEKRVLQGELGYTVFEGLADISGEAYPLKAGAHPMVDLCLGDDKNPLLHLSQETIRYVPLRARNEVVGILLVDNLLSQQEITQDEVHLLETLAGQLGLAIKNAELYEGVEELSITDELTKLYLARYFKERLDQECLRAARTNASFAVCMLDVDHFKSINDTYGHPMGDRVLQGLARQLKAVSRKIDVVARYAGDEFIILLPNTNAEQALQFGQRLKQSVNDLLFPLPHEQVLRIGVSAGISVYPLHGTQAEELMKLADVALYQSKRSGRNNVNLYSPEAEQGHEEMMARKAAEH